MFWPIFKTLVFDCLLGVIMVLGTIWQFGASQVIPQQKNIVICVFIGETQVLLRCQRAFSSCKMHLTFLPQE
jgi:hypothetical protein